MNGFLLRRAAQFGSICLALLTGCAVDDPVGSEQDDATEAHTFKFVTYNVGGLADIVSSGSPSEMMPLISPRLNAYDLVVVQEDFEYHESLVSRLTLPFQVTPGKANFPKLYGDGLAIFSRMATGFVEKQQWRKCNGTFGNKNDCLAEKGLRRTVVTVAPNLEVDVYDLHMDAGRDGDDVKARDAQVTQLAEFLNFYSKDRPVIVAGDTNMKASDEPSFQRMLQLTSLRDTCRELHCPNPELHDRVLIRDGWAHKITPANWRIETSFRAPDGRPLSDHNPVAVDISLSKIPVETSSAARADSGFALAGSLRLMNETGVCAQASSVPLGTAPCSDTANQTFAIYQMPDGAFELCQQNTLRLVNAGSPSAEYRATCLSRVGDTTELRFLATTLSKQSSNGFQAEPGHVIKESDGILGWKDSVRKLTKDDDGIVVLGKDSGHPDQKWTTF